jgi:hypothetical protein
MPHPKKKSQGDNGEEIDHERIVKLQPDVRLKGYYDFTIRVFELGQERNLLRTRLPQEQMSYHFAPARQGGI